MGGGGFEPPKAEPGVQTAGSSSEILLRNGLRWPHIRARARTRASLSIRRPRVRVRSFPSARPRPRGFPRWTAFEKRPNESLRPRP
jgi:hypothetical protein